MNRQQRRASESVGRRLQKKEWNEFQDVTEEAKEKGRLLGRDMERDKFFDRVYQNNKYIVQIFDNVERKGKVYTKVMLRKSDSTPMIGWNDLYRIKCEIFGDEVEAVQFLPPKSELVDVANLYWFWIEGTTSSAM